MWGIKNRRCEGRKDDSIWEEVILLRGVSCPVNNQMTELEG